MSASLVKFTLTHTLRIPDPDVRFAGFPNQISSSHSLSRHRPCQRFDAFHLAHQTFRESEHVECSESSRSHLKGF